MAVNEKLNSYDDLLESVRELEDDNATLRDVISELAVEIVTLKRRSAPGLSVDQ